MEGWIKLHRQLTTHWLWEQKPFDKCRAWIDLLLAANHEPKTFMLGSELVEVERGETITSEVILADRWGWSRTKVRNFLQLLEFEGMIKNHKEGRKRTRLRVLNYADFQGLENKEKTEKEQKKDKQKTSKEQAKNINKNDKNDENDKKVIKIKYAEYVRMTAKEYEKLVSQYGEAATLKMIEILDNYKGSSGKAYKDDYRAILSWVVAKVIGSQGKITPLKPLAKPKSQDLLKRMLVEEVRINEQNRSDSVIVNPF